MRNSLKRAAALAFAVLMLLTLVPASLAEEIASAPQTQTSEWVVPGISDGGALVDSVRNYSDAFERLMAEEDADAFSELAGQYKADEGFWTWISQSLEAGTLTEERVAALNEKIAAADNAGAFDELAITGPSKVPVGGTITLTSASGSATDASLHTWSVSSTRYATVAGNGQTATVTGVQAGSTVTITHKYKNSQNDWRWTSETLQVAVITSITGPDTVAVGGAITLTSLSGSLDDASLHTWSVNQTQYATVTGGGRTAVLNGVAAGTVTVTHEFRNSAGGTEYTDTFQVTVQEPEEEEAQVYYLKTPTSDPDSNETDQWGRNIGNGKVETTGGTWVDDKNIFNPSAFVKGMPTGMVEPDGSYLLPNNDTYKRDYDAIYAAYKTQLENDLGVTLSSADDIEAIYLVPYKISRNNSSNPDKHIDCTIRVKLKDDLVFAAVFWVTMPGGSVKQVDAKNYQKGSSVTKTDKAPTDSTGAYPDEMVHVDGITYVFDGWYSEAEQKISDSAWPYEPSSAELADGTVNFYAKYVPKQTTVTVRKIVVSGTDADKQKDFTFTYTDSDGETKTFTLRNKTEMTIPVKVGQENFKVTETEDTLFSTTYEIGSAGALEGCAATINKIEDDGNYTIVFTNTRRTGTLTIAKQVTGNMGDRTKRFHFTYSYGTTNGDFTLVNGEEMKLTDLPYGTVVTITEEDYSSSGYKTSYAVGNAEAQTGCVATVTIGADEETITFTNHKDGYPDTGVLLDSLPYALILAAVVIAAAIVIVRRRRHRDDD